jgi:hypothetical protein
MTTKNPFPGMNPFLERSWPGIRLSLLVYMADSISELLPEDTYCRCKKESFESPEPPEHWIEIHDSGGTLVTVIEVLSPTNKRPPGNRDYLAKQSRYLNARVNLVEIDLIRAGSHVLPFDPQILKGDKHGAAYHVCVCPAHGYASKEIYPMHLRSRLPAFTIPLREKDKRVVLDLQPLLDRAYEKGRHWQDNFTEALVPQLSTEDLDWANERLLEAGLISPK